MGVRVREKPKGSGVWWVFLNHQGRRKAKRVGEGRKGRQAADLAALKIRARLAEGDSGIFEPEPQRAPTFAQYAEQWLRAHSALQLKPISAERYHSVLKSHLLPAFGQTPVTALTRASVKAQLARWLEDGKVRGKGPLRPRTVRLLAAMLRAILNGALDDGILTANPAARLGRLIASDRFQDDVAPDPFTADEVRQLLQAAERDYPDWHAFFLTMARTGLRVGECLALQHDDLDLGHGLLWVRRNWTRGRLGSPKGKRSRAVDLTPQLVDALRAWGSVREAEAVVAGCPPSPWVFPGPDGGPWDDRWMRWNVWRPLVRAAGLRHRGMHQLRHSYATRLIAAGAHPKYIQAQLGHASIQVTMDVYGHLFPGTFARLVNVLDDATDCNPRATTRAHPTENV